MNLYKNKLLFLIVALVIILSQATSFAVSDFKAAEQYLKRASNSSIPETRYALAHKALEEYKGEYDKNNLNLDAMIGMGKAYILLDNRSEAKHILMSADCAYPNDPKSHVALADFYSYSQEYNTAIEFYKLALLSGYLKDYNTNLATAICYQKLGDVENAILYYKIAIYLNPNDKVARDKLNALVESNFLKTLPSNPAEIDKT